VTTATAASKAAKAIATKANSTAAKPVPPMTTPTPPLAAWPLTAVNSRLAGIAHPGFCFPGSQAAFLPEQFLIGSQGVLFLSSLHGIPLGSAAHPASI
jgi:hypothetical protein